MVGNINTKSVYDMKNVDSNCRMESAKQQKETDDVTHIHYHRLKQIHTRYYTYIYIHTEYHIVACIIALSVRFCCSFYRCC